MGDIQRPAWRAATTQRPQREKSCPENVGSKSGRDWAGRGNEGGFSAKTVRLFRLAYTSNSGGRRRSLAPMAVDLSKKNSSRCHFLALAWQSSWRLSVEKSCVGGSANHIAVCTNVGNIKGPQTSMLECELNEVLPLLRVLIFLPRILVVRALIDLPDLYWKADGYAERFAADHSSCC
jgi:hypothetical protein